MQRELLWINKQTIVLSLEISATIIHLGLVAGLVLLISYFNDLYSCVILLIYQIGLVVNPGFKNQFDHTLGICMLSFNVLCFVWVLVKFMSKDKNELEEENNNILENYKRGNQSDNNKSDIEKEVQ